MRQIEVVSEGARTPPFAVVLDSVADHHPVQTETETETEQEAQESAVARPVERVHEGEDGQGNAGVVRDVGGTRTRNPLGDMHDFKVEDMEGQVVRISISHDGGYATAVAIAPEMPAEL